MAKSDATSPANVRETIRQIFRDNNYDPFLVLVKAAKDPDTPLNKRIEIASDLAGYIAPKLKGVDIDAKMSGNIQVVVQRLAETMLEEASSEEPRIVDLGTSTGVQGE